MAARIVFDGVRFARRRGRGAEGRAGFEYPGPTFGSTAVDDGKQLELDEAPAASATAC